MFTPLNNVVIGTVCILLFVSVALTKVQLMKSVLELMSCDGIVRLGTLLQVSCLACTNKMCTYTCTFTLLFSLANVCYIQYVRICGMLRVCDFKGKTVHMLP